GFLEILDHLGADAMQIRRAQRDGDAAVPGTGEIEQVADDVLDAVDAASGAVRASLHRLRIGGIPQQPADGEVDHAEGVADVVAHDFDDPVLELLCGGELPLLVLFPIPLRPATVVDVDAASDETLECAALAVERRPAIEDPAVDAVVATQPVLHLEAFALLEAIQISRDTPL